MRRSRLWQRLKTSLGFHFFLLVLAGVVGYDAYRASRVVDGARRELARIEGETAAARGRRAELNAALLELRTPQAQEREAKARLNLKRRGEEVVVVPPDETASPAASTTSAWNKFLEFLSGFLRRFFSL